MIAVSTTRAMFSPKCVGVSLKQSKPAKEGAVNT